jgi:aspartate carbamoyltransferase catalytic subunit
VTLAGRKRRPGLVESKHLLDVDDLTREDIERVLETARSFSEVLRRPIKKVPSLRGKTVVNLFFEPSTRTRMSFEVAAKRLSADVMNFTASTSSVEKGESLKDTALTLEAMGVDAVVVRHPVAGAPWLLRQWLEASILNAGDGMHAHPTQALLDLFTIRQIKGRIEGLKVVIVGDILHSRVARSNIWGFMKLGAEVRVVGPPTLVPKYIESIDVKSYYSLDKAVEGADVVIMLRIQKERQDSEYFPSLREYSRFYGLTREKLRCADKDVTVMHPGPINRGVELSSDIADGPGSVILEQVANGIAVRMAMFYLVASARSSS